MFNFSNKTLGRIAGGSIILMAVISGFVFPTLQATLPYVIGISLVIILDVIVAVALYYLFQPNYPTVSFWMAALRIIYAFFFFIALLNIQNLEYFNSIWSRALIIFGLHLMLLGYLVYRSKQFPKLLGALVIFNGLGYTIDGISKYASIYTNIAVYTFLGELLLGFWLLFLKNEDQHKSIK